MQTGPARTGITAAGVLGAVYGLALALDVLRFSARPYSASDSALLLIPFGVLFGLGALALATLLAWPLSRLSARMPSVAADRAIVFGTAGIVYLSSTLLSGQIMAMYWVKHPEVETLAQALWHQTLKVAAVLAVGVVVAGLLAWAARFAARHWVAIMAASLLLAFGGTLALTSSAFRTGYERPQTPVASLEPEHPRKVFLFGIDAIDVKWIEKFMEEGRMPYLSRIWARASKGRLRTLALSDTPRVWTTVQTGMLPARHGVVSHLRWSFPGMSEPVSMPTRRKLNFLFDALGRTTGLVQQRPIVHGDARTRKLWQIASDAGLRTTAISYYGTRPVFPLRGSVLAYGAGRDLLAAADGHERLSPADVPSLLYSDLNGWSIRAPDVTSGLFWAAAALHEVMAVERPDLLGLYVSINDAPGHQKLQYYMPHLFIGVDEAGIEAHGEAYPRSFNALDDFIKEIMEQVPDDYLTLVVSDHGMEPVLGEPAHWGGHAEQIDGIFMAWGPGVVPGEAPDISVVDIAPTVLALLGLPPSEDMQGEPVLGCLEPGARPPVLPPIASYDAAGPPVASFVEAGHEELMEQLRSLGYME